jgi:hypothetical protein
MKKIDWLSERDFMLDGVKFHCELEDYSQKTNAERIVILKNRGALEPYADMFADVPPRNMLEFGIFQGGSPALFSLWLELDKFVGIDICQPVTAFDDFCRSHDLGRRIRSYYGVSQTDRERIENIVRTEFSAAPLDVVIDDASHKYSLTRRTFEIAFPLLRPGGMYVIEDWGWAHWAGSRHYIGETALSMLIMEIMMLCASRGDLVGEVRIFPWIAFIRKSPNAVAISDFSLDSSYRKRGMELVGANPVRLRGVANLLVQRIANSARRRLQRVSRRLSRIKRR